MEKLPEFENLFNRLQPYGKGVGSPYCFLISKLNREIPERAALHEIPHATADAFVARVVEVFKPGMEESARTSLAHAISDEWAKLKTPADLSQRPFQGCLSCRRPCQFRFDTSLLVTDEQIKLVKDSSYQTIIDTIRPIAVRNLSINVRTAIEEDWIFCFCVQAASKGIAQQKTFASELAEKIFQPTDAAV